MRPTFCRSRQPPPFPFAAVAGDSLLLGLVGALSPAPAAQQSVRRLALYGQEIKNGVGSDGLRRGPCRFCRSILFSRSRHCRMQHLQQLPIAN